MKTFNTVAFCMIFFSLSAQKHPGDTIINGIAIRFSSNTGIFPVEWQAAPINAAASPIVQNEIKRSKQIAAVSIRKYPYAFLQKNLTEVYFLSTITFYNVEYGGTNSSEQLYLTNSGIQKGYTNHYVEQMFHHELSSILYRNFHASLDKDAWLKANIAGFDYSDPENGVGAIRNNESSQELDTALCRKGFLTQYSLSGMENDINTFAQNLFLQSPGFWTLVDTYPRISQKAHLLMAFYQRLHPQFTEGYFRKISQ